MKVFLEDYNNGKIEVWIIAIYMQESSYIDFNYNYSVSFNNSISVLKYQSEHGAKVKIFKQQVTKYTKMLYKY